MGNCFWRLVLDRFGVDFLACAWHDGSVGVQGDGEDGEIRFPTMRA